MDYGVGDWVVCVERSGKLPLENVIEVGRKLAVRELFPPGTEMARHLGLRATLEEWGVMFVAHKNADHPLGFEVPYPARQFRKFDPKTNEDDEAVLAEKALSDIRARIIEAENDRRWAILASPGLGQPWGQS